MINLWTDGGCNNRTRTKHGGWAFVVERDGQVVDRKYGWELDTTSNRMEMTAALNALWYARANRFHYLGNTVVIYSDSQYLVNGAVDWARRWRANGWITASGGEVKNVDLWKGILTQIQDMRVLWHWVRGHNGTELNEEADRLCTQAMRRAVWVSNRRRGLG